MPPRALCGLVIAGLFGSFSGAANASFVLDTGLPQGGSFDVLNSSQSLAGEFYAPAGDNITALSAYLTVGAGQPGEVFSFEIFSNTNFIGGRNLVPLYSTSATFTTNGWTTDVVNWTPTTSGDYWLALVAPQGTNLDAPGETSTTTGTVPALGFAVTSGGRYATSSTGIGLEITGVSPVPVPSADLLFGSALLGSVGFWMRGRRRMSGR